MPGASLEDESHSSLFRSRGRRGVRSGVFENGSGLCVDEPPPEGNFLLKLSVVDGVLRVSESGETPGM